MWTLDFCKIEQRTFFYSRHFKFSKQEEKEKLQHSHVRTDDVGPSIRSDLEFNVLLKNTLAYEQDEPGIEPPTTGWLLGDCIYILSRSLSQQAVLYIWQPKGSS